MSSTDVSEVFAREPRTPKSWKLGQFPGGVAVGVGVGVGVVGVGVGEYEAGTKVGLVSV